MKLKRIIFTLQIIMSVPSLIFFFLLLNFCSLSFQQPKGTQAQMLATNMLLCTPNHIKQVVADKG